MNKFDRAMIRLLLVFFPLISIATATAWSQEKDNLPQENEVDPAYREDASDDRETQLKKERIRSVMAELGPKEMRFLPGHDQVFEVLECQKRLCTALLDFHNEPKKIISILEQQVEVTKDIETNRKTRFEQGVGRPDEYAGATYFRADAELQLLRAQQKFNVVDGNHQPLPIPQLGNSPHDPDQFRDEVPQELGLPGEHALSESEDGNKTRAAQHNKIDEWMKGTYSPAPYKIAPGDDVETQLKKQRINMALMEMDHFSNMMHAGISLLDVAVESQKRLLEAQLDFHTDPREIVAVWQQALESAKNVEVVVRTMFQGGSDVTVQQVGQATFNRLDFELKLLQAKKKHGLPEHSKEESTK